MLVIPKAIFAPCASPKVCNTGGIAAVLAGEGSAVALKLTLWYLCCYVYMEPEPESLAQFLPVGVLLGSASIPYLQGLVGSGSSAARGNLQSQRLPRGLDHSTDVFF